MILTSFHYGYICLQIPGAWLATRVGGHRLFGLAVLLASVLAVATPFLVRWHVYLFIALRVVQGIVLVSDLASVASLIHFEYQGTMLDSSGYFTLIKKKDFSYSAITTINVVYLLKMSICTFCFICFFEHTDFAFNNTSSHALADRFIICHYFTITKSNSYSIIRLLNFLFLWEATRG